MKKDSYPLPKGDNTQIQETERPLHSQLAKVCGSLLTVMPIGLCNAPPTLERGIEAVLKGLH